LVSNTVSVINPSINTVVATIPVGINPRGIAFNPDNGFLYVTNFGSDTVSVINPVTNTVVGAPISVGSGPRSVAFNSDNGFLYVTNFISNTVSVINPSTNTVVATILGVFLPGGIAFNPDNGLLYGTSVSMDGSVFVIAPITTTFSEGCNGAIESASQTPTCTVTNAYGRQ
jgi:YVTN family beta-propeller protein